jgi:hypothetical protein
MKSTVKFLLSRIIMKNIEAEILKKADKILFLTERDESIN